MEYKIKSVLDKHGIVQQIENVHGYNVLILKRINGLNLQAIYEDVVKLYNHTPVIPDLTQHYIKADELPYNVIFKLITIYEKDIHIIIPLYHNYVEPIDIVGFSEIFIEEEKELIYKNNTGSQRIWEKMGKFLKHASENNGCIIPLEINVYHYKNLIPNDFSNNTTEFKVLTTPLETHSCFGQINLSGVGLNKVYEWDGKKKIVTYFDSLRNIHKTYDYKTLDKVKVCEDFGIIINDHYIEKPVLFDFHEILSDMYTSKMRETLRNDIDFGSNYIMFGIDGVVPVISIHRKYEPDIIPVEKEYYKHPDKETMELRTCSMLVVVTDDSGSYTVYGERHLDAFKKKIEKYTEIKNWTEVKYGIHTFEI